MIVCARRTDVDYTVTGLRTYCTNGQVGASSTKSGVCLFVTDSKHLQGDVEMYWRDSMAMTTPRKLSIGHTKKLKDV